MNLHQTSGREVFSDKLVIMVQEVTLHENFPGILLTSQENILRMLPESRSSLNGDVMCTGDKEVQKVTFLIL